MRIISGGLYLVNLSGYVSPEFGLLHYCVIFKTYDREIFLALPTTSKTKNDRFIPKIPEDGSFYLLKHARPISIRRVVGPLLDKNNNHIIMSNEHLEMLINNYIYFIRQICISSLKSNRMILKNIKELQKSK
jgi:hypothetical protein